MDVISENCVRVDGRKHDKAATNISALGELFRHPGAELRLSKPERKAIDYCLKTICFGAGAGDAWKQVIIFEADLFNTLAIYTFILSTFFFLKQLCKPPSFFQ